MRLRTRLTELLAEARRVRRGHRHAVTRLLDELLADPDLTRQILSRYVRPSLHRLAAAIDRQARRRRGRP
jgi:hypothetical protein